MPHRQTDLVVGTSDSYVALIKADADGLGRILPFLNGDPQVIAFSEALDSCVREANVQAVMHAIPDADTRKPFPLIPLVAAGEDIWALTSRDIALEFATKLAAAFAALVQGDSRFAILNQVAAAAQTRLTLSVGVLFSKQGFPIDARLDLAEELLHNAKLHRRQLQERRPAPAVEGCIDYFWWESSARHTVRDARRDVLDGSLTYRLRTRPWQISEATNWIEASAKLGDKEHGIPSRKLHQLQQILRRGRLSTLAYQQWLNSLSGDERESLKEGCNLIGKSYQTPWTFDKNEAVWTTPLAELAELAEILPRPEQATSEGSLDAVPND